jgi:hypothetical protein
VCCGASGTGITVVVTVHLGLTATDEVDTENLGVQSRVEVAGWTMFAVTIEVANRSINESSTVGANSLTAVSSKPVAVAVTLRGFATSTMSSTVVWTRRIRETQDSKERDHFCMLTFLKLSPFWSLPKLTFSFLVLQFLS